MKRICILLTNKPNSEEKTNQIWSLANQATENSAEAAVYLLGNGVLCAKKNQKDSFGNSLRTALKNGITVRAGKRDLSARAITEDHLEEGIEVIDDLEGAFVEDIMEKADRVVSW